MKRTLLLALVLATGALLVGCGDDDDGEALSASEFRRQANAICKEVNSRVDAAAEDLFADLEEGETPDPDAIEAFIDDEVAPGAEQIIEGIGDLEPPKELADDVAQLLDEAEEALQNLREKADDDPVAIFESGEDPFAEVDERSGELGLDECAGSEGEGDDVELEAAVAGIEPEPDHAYCAVERKVDGIFEEAFSDRDETDTDDAVAQRAAQRIIDEGLIEQGEAVVPDVIRADFEVLVAAVRSAAQSDFSNFESADTERAGVRVDYFCGLNDEN